MTEEVKNAEVETKETTATTTTEVAKVETKTEYTKYIGYGVAALIILVMFILNWCGVVQFKNVDDICKYAKESAKISAMSYFQASKDKFTSEEADAIVNEVNTSIATVTEKLATQTFDSKDAKNLIQTELNKVIEEKCKNPDLVKKLSDIALTAAFNSLDTYTNDVSLSSGDYIKVLKSISEGIKEGKSIVYPVTK